MYGYSCEYMFTCICNLTAIWHIITTNTFPPTLYLILYAVVCISDFHSIEIVTHRASRGEYLFTNTNNDYPHNEGT